MNLNHLIKAVFLLFIFSSYGYSQSTQLYSNDNQEKSLQYSAKLQNNGFIHDAKWQLEKAYSRAKNPQQRNNIALLQCRNQFKQGETGKALKGIQKIIQSGSNRQKIHAYLQLAKHYQSIGDNELAIKTYNKALMTDDPYLQSIVYLNKSKSLDSDALKTELNLASKAIEKINNSAKKAKLNGILGQRALEQFPKLAMESFKSAEKKQDLLSKRNLSQLFGYQGKWYEGKGDSIQALKYTSKAIQAGQVDLDLLFKWEWQQARILSTQKQIGALLSYRRAADYINKLRTDMPVRYNDGRSSFRETFEPFYLGFARLLLSQSDTAKGDEKQLLLREAQGVIESIKSAELQDYFKDTCAVVQRPLLDAQEYLDNTAIIYPIVFHDRLDILLALKNKLKRFTLSISKKKLYKTVRLASKRLRRSFKGNYTSINTKKLQQLYQLLIEPLSEDLKKHDIDTLVYVPYGKLRTLPISTLWDGKHYLIEQYAIATVPGVSLLDPKPLAKNVQISALLAGLSKPGNSVNKLPSKMQSSLLTRAGISSNLTTNLASREIKFRALPTTEDALVKDISTKELSTKDSSYPKVSQKRQAQLQQVLVLPGVEEEINQLSKLLNSKGILNKEFTLERFETNVYKGKRIVHVASHGVFTGDPETSFIMAYDKLINMNKLESLFKSESFKDTPVELLTLSACQTAEGDDRSPLGLSGVALKSGARSTLGSLWPVSDEAAKTLLPAFYSELIKPNISKAKALQLAQIKLIKNKKMSHPIFWAAFILIGNWL